MPLLLRPSREVWMKLSQNLTEGTDAIRRKQPDKDVALYIEGVYRLLDAMIKQFIVDSMRVEDELVVCHSSSIIPSSSSTTVIHQQSSSSFEKLLHPKDYRQLQEASRKFIEQFISMKNFCRN